MSCLPKQARQKLIEQEFLFLPMTHIFISWAHLWDLNFRWAPRWFCWFCHTQAHISNSYDKTTSLAIIKTTTIISLGEINSKNSKYLWYINNRSKTIRTKCFDTLSLSRWGPAPSGTCFLLPLFTRINFFIFFVPCVCPFHLRFSQFLLCFPCTCTCIILGWHQRWSKLKRSILNNSRKLNQNYYFYQFKLARCSSLQDFCFNFLKASIVRISMIPTASRAVVKLQ